MQLNSLLAPSSSSSVVPLIHKEITWDPGRVSNQMMGQVKRMKSWRMKAELSQNHAKVLIVIAWGNLPHTTVCMSAWSPCAVVHTFLSLFSSCVKLEDIVKRRLHSCDSILVRLSIYIPELWLRELRLIYCVDISHICCIGNWYIALISHIYCVGDIYCVKENQCWRLIYHTSTVLKTTWYNVCWRLRDHRRLRWWLIFTMRTLAWRPAWRVETLIFLYGDPSPLKAFVNCALLLMEREAVKTQCIEVICYVAWWKCKNPSFSREVHKTYFWPNSLHGVTATPFGESCIF